jgi:Cdc6-like AAA superfamily ATPase
MSWIERVLPWRKRAKPRTTDDSASTYVWRPASPQSVDAAFAEEQTFPRFQTTAGDQVDPRVTDRFAISRAKVRRAFTPAQPITDRRMFAGRTKVMTTLMRSIEDQRLHTVIYGERGIGKTSVLQVLAKAAIEARYLVVYITCGAQSDFDSTFRNIATHIPLMYHADYGPTTVEGERGDTLASILGPDPVSVSFASDMLSRIEGTRVLVILDEYDRTQSEEFRRAVAELLKSLSDQAVRVQVLIAGVAANLTELVANVPSIQRNVFAMRIPKMTGEEVRNIIRKGEAVSDLRFDEDAVELVVNNCMGFPYLASLISHRAALVAMDDGRLTVGADDVAAATNEALEEFRARISRRSLLQIEALMAQGHRDTLSVLAAAAQSTGGWFRLEDIADPHADNAAIDDIRAAAERFAAQNRLIEVGDDGFARGFRFAEPTVPVYLWLMTARSRGAQGAARSLQGAAN